MINRVGIERAMYKYLMENGGNIFKVLLEQLSIHFAVIIVITVGGGAVHKIHSSVHITVLWSRFSVRFGIR